MSALDFAARSSAQEARDMAEAVAGTAEQARGAAAKAEGTAQAALSASEQASKAVDASRQEMEAARKAADAAGQTAQAAGTAAEAANTTAQGAERLARDAAAGVPRLFTSMAAARLPAGVTVIGSNGYSEIGTGAATYVSDAKATAELAAAHPLACFKGDGDRYFRLAPDAQGFITPEQLGCPLYAPGVNAQPFIQAALYYAGEIGAALGLAQTRYDLWAPLRESGRSADDVQGSYMILQHATKMVGLGSSEVLLRLLNSEGGRNDITTQRVVLPNWPSYMEGGHDGNNYPWIGHGIALDPQYATYLKPIDFLHLENIELDSTHTYDPATSREPGMINLMNKGTRIIDQCRRIYMRNVTMRNFAGEIYYTGGNSVLKEEYLENCTFEGSPQCAFNPGTAARGTYINLQTGRSYQNEIMGGAGKTFLGGRFYDLESCIFMGGAAGGDDGVGGAPFYAYPMRKSTGSAPYVIFGSGFTMERCGNAAITSFCQGQIIAVDTSIDLRWNLGKLIDIDLDVISYVDRGMGITEAIAIGGPSSLDVPVGNPAVFIEPPNNIRVSVTCRQTDLAKAAGRVIPQAIRVNAGLIDANSVTLTVAGVARRSCSFAGTIPAGYKWPKIVLTPDFRLAEGIYGVGVFNYVNADRTITLWAGGNGVEPLGNGPFTVGVDNAGIGFVDGQVATIQHTGNNNRVVRISASGAGLRLQQDRYLINQGDTISLRWVTPSRPGSRPATGPVPC